MDIKELRQLFHLSQSGFAKRFNVPLRTLQEWEQGRSRTPQYFLEMGYEIYQAEQAEKEKEAEKPDDESYLERGLPPFLQESIDKLKHTLELISRGENPSGKDMDWDEAYSSINAAESGNDISHKQAEYLRHKYLWAED